MVQPSTSSQSGSLGPLIGRAQYKCNKRVYPLSQSPDSAASLAQSAYPTTPTPASSHDRSVPTSSFALLIPAFTAGVPAFAAPMTQVRSPVVKRAQWEVVVRAALVAMVGATVLVGVVIGVVP